MMHKTRIWLQGSKRGVDKCEICRASAMALVEMFSFGGREFLRRRCRECGHEDTVRKDSGARAYVVTSTQNVTNDYEDQGPHT